MTTLQAFDLPEGELLDVQSIGECVMSASQSITELVLRFFLNLVSCFIITGLLYYPKSRRSDYSFTFMAFSTAMLLLLHMMGRVDVGVGLTLGLFAIFGIIRYRTETVPIREMTYLFIIIAVAAINGLSTVYKIVTDTAGDSSYVLSPDSIGVTALTNALIIILLAVLESILSKAHSATKMIQYDKIKLIVPEKKAELIDDLKLRTGLDVVDVEVGQIDFLRDSALIKITYHPAKGETFSIQNKRKLYEN